jgi:photosystem II stability/assembly factor-like uncharacterized protein
MSQLFHSSDAGTTWQTTDFREIQGGHESRVNFINNSSIRYALDYSTINGSDLVRPSKSIDNGANWTPLANDPTGNSAFYFFADPNNANRLAITDYTNLYFSNDGGATWNQRYTGDANAGLLLGGAFWDGNNIYFGTNSGLLVSTNGGTSFSAVSVGGLPSGDVIIAFAGAKQNNVTRFVAVAQPAADTWAGLAGYDNGGGASVATLDYGSANWTVRTLPASDYPFYAAMATGNTSVMYVAGGSSSGTPTVYKSSNGGSTWASAFNTAGNANIQTGWSGSGGDRDWGYGELAFGLTVAASDPNRIIVSDEGFAHASTDGGATWKALYVNPNDLNPAGANTPTGKLYHSSGLDNTTSWDITWAGTNNVFISNSDVRGQLSTDSGQSFGFGYAGHSLNSMYYIAKASNGTLYGAEASIHDLYQSTHLTDSTIDGGTGAVLASTNNGATWTTIHSFGKVVDWVATDPTNSNRLYASVASSTVGGVYVTNNLSAGASSTWTKVTNPPRTEGHAFSIVVLNNGNLLASFSGHRTSNFTASSGVFLSTDGGTTWSDRSAAGLQYWTQDVVVDPSDSTQQTWYAGVYGGWGGPANDLGGLYRTTNAGVTWTRILTLHGVTSATVNPANTNEIFVASETDGLWYSNNIHAATPTFTQVKSYPFRQPERVFFNPSNSSEIWVTSFGGGVFVGTAALPAASSINSTSANGTYSTGQSINVTLNFNQPVTLTGGNLNITLDTGAVVTVAPFSGSTASATYVVAAGQTSPDLNVTNLALAGGATFKDPYGNAVSLTLPASNLANNANIIVNPAAPTTVSFFTVNAGSTQRSRLTTVTVQFTNPVNAANFTAAGAITFTRTMGGTTGTVVQPGATGANGRVLVSPSTGMTSTLTLTFDNANGAATTAGVENGSLADGRWQMAIPSLGYTSTLNDPSLRRLFGDFNNDGTVDGTDFAAFGTAFGQTAANSPFDINGDGTVDGTDFAQFGTRFGLTL